MDELNGRLIVCQLLLAGLVARAANSSPDPLRFVTDFRDEMHAIVAGVRIGGVQDESVVRKAARETLDEIFSLMKPPSDGAKI
ncbi:MAG: hypothetical protein ACK5JM_00940 [Rhodoblastus sp.]